MGELLTTAQMCYNAGANAEEVDSLLDEFMRIGQDTSEVQEQTAHQNALDRGQMPATSNPGEPDGSLCDLAPAASGPGKSNSDGAATGDDTGTGDGDGGDDGTDIGAQKWCRQRQQ
mmetsp:Transcript_42850/g.115294  ORF Transcript_42850/g.115294 Transcript_42850/m.115294 type:complete len:116 (+) Transcript_42850:518-865(+)